VVTSAMLGDLPPSNARHRVMLGTLSVKNSFQVAGDPAEARWALPGPPSLPSVPCNRSSAGADAAGHFRRREKRLGGGSDMVLLLSVSFNGRISPRTR